MTRCPIHGREMAIHHDYGFPVEWCPQCTAEAERYLQPGRHR